MRILPNLLIIGAQKAGTTWLRHRLMQHPEIFMSKVKEVNFFTKQAAQRDLDEYSDHFEAGAGFRYRGEATPGYFWTYSEKSEYCSLDPSGHELEIPRAVMKTLGSDVKLIVSLRHPVHRAVSAYFHHYKMGRITDGQSILEFGKRSGIIDMGFYARHLRAWESVFGKNKIFVIFFDDIEKQGGRVVNSVCEHLGLAPYEVAGADTAEHVGLKLTVMHNALMVDSKDEYTARLLRKRQLDSSPMLAIRRKDLLAVQRLYRPDVEYIESRFDRRDLNWSKPIELGDFVDGGGGHLPNREEP